MEILKESVNSSAWCISRTGRQIPVRVHPFGALDDDSIEDAAWLFVVKDGYDNQSLVKYIANQMCYDYGLDKSWSDADLMDIVSESLNDIESIKGLQQTKSLVESVYSYLLSRKAIDDDNDDLAEYTETDVDDMSLEIKQHLNENYIRARLGSEYQNYVERKGAIYFRTSSTDGFNWYSVIVDFLCSLPRSAKVSEVTIERDVSATGDRKVYIDHMPFEDFLMRKPVVIESVIKCSTIGGE